MVNSFRIFLSDQPTDMFWEKSKREQALFSEQKVFFSWGVGQGSPAVYLNQLAVFRIGFGILRMSIIKMHCQKWTAH